MTGNAKSQADPEADLGTIGSQTHPQGNWGRWGSDDELGAINLITPQVRLSAFAGLTKGRMYSLSPPLSASAPHADGRNPVWHTVTRTHNEFTGRGSADDIFVTHSHVGTHIDALCHYWGSEGLYNHFPHDRIGPLGSPALSIDRVEGIVTRGVMIDVASEIPEGKAAWGFVVTRELLQSQLASSGITIRPGDAVLIRTGWAHQHLEDQDIYSWGEPGIGSDAAEWLASEDVVLVGSDNWAVEAVPPEVKGEGLAVHRALLNLYGIYLVENLVLDDLASAEGSCVGVLAIAPIRLQGGAGSPVNPLMVV